MHTVCVLLCYAVVQYCHTVMVHRRCKIMSWYPSIWLIMITLLCTWLVWLFTTNTIHHMCTSQNTSYERNTSIGTEAKVHDTQLKIIYPCHKINVVSADLLVNKAPESCDVSLAAQWIPLNADWIHHYSLGPLWTQVLCCQHRDVWQCRADYHMTEWHLLL